MQFCISWFFLEEIICFLVECSQHGRRKFVFLNTAIGEIKSSLRPHLTKKRRKERKWMFRAMILWVHSSPFAMLTTRKRQIWSITPSSFFSFFKLKAAVTLSQKENILQALSYFNTEFDDFNVSNKVRWALFPPCSNEGDCCTVLIHTGVIHCSSVLFTFKFTLAILLHFVSCF